LACFQGDLRGGAGAVSKIPYVGAYEFYTADFGDSADEALASPEPPPFPLRLRYDPKGQGKEAADAGAHRGQV